MKIDYKLIVDSHSPVEKKTLSLRTIITRFANILAVKYMAHRHSPMLIDTSSTRGTDRYLTEHTPRTKFEKEYA